MAILRRLPLLTGLSGLLAAAAFAGVSAPSAMACAGGSYVYAGVAGDAPVAGVGASITPLPDDFQVRAGHIAGWVGVGGPGEGPNGTDEWIQVGFSAFPGSVGSDLYYEVARPGSTPVYHRVRAAVTPPAAMRVAVLEMHGRRDWWRVWVDGAPVSAPIYLPASDEQWRPVVTAESWDGGASTCNDFLYQFGSIRIASHPGGTWSPLAATTTISEPTTMVRRRTRDVFDAAGGPTGRRVLAQASPDSLPSIAG
jgi:hypothetical protein